MAQAFQFAPPSNYSDWANYAGFDRKTGEQQSFSGGIAPSADTSSGIEPPKSLNEFFQRKMEPVTNTYNKLTAAAGEAGKGNFSNAYNTMKTPTSQFGMTQGQQDQAISYDHIWN
jgi:hypothetical protein